MKKYLVALLLVCCSYLSAANWSLTVGTIPLGAAINDVTMAYYPKTKQVVAAWANLSDALPYFSVYNGTSWSNAQPLLPSNTIGVQNNVTLQSFPKLKIIVAAWGEAVLPRSPYYSIFNGSTWSTPLVINPSSPFSVDEDIAMTYDKKNNRIVAAWSLVDVTSFPGNPVYSIFDMSMNWSQAAPITTLFTTQGEVSVTYNKTDQQVMAAWTSFSGLENLPYSSVLTSTWSAPVQIPIAGPGTDVNDQVALGSSIMINQVFAAWGTRSGSHPIYGNTYNVTPNMWNVAASLDAMYGSVGTDFNVNFGVNKASGEVFIAWQDTSTRTPYYSIFSSLNGGMIPFMPSAGVNQNVNLAYDETSAQMIAVWTDSGMLHTIYFNTYQ